jgi:hypothetical protein
MTVYLDMDGVLVDFFGGVEKRFNVKHWKSIQDREVAFATLANTNFFYELEAFDEANKIIDYVKKATKLYNTNWGICSSPLRGDTMNSSYWKRRWLEDKFFTPDLVEDMIFTSNKHKYALNTLTRKPNILIDDKPENIRSWTKAGGIGIRFQTNEDDLEEYLFVEIEKALIECQ